MQLVVVTANRGPWGRFWGLWDSLNCQDTESTWTHVFPPYPPQGTLTRSVNHSVGVSLMALRLWTEKKFTMTLEQPTWISRVCCDLKESQETFLAEHRHMLGVRAPLAAAGAMFSSHLYPPVSLSPGRNGPHSTEECKLVSLCVWTGVWRGLVETVSERYCVSHTLSTDVALWFSQKLYVD